MTKFEPRSICILGRQPALGLAELESLYGAEHLESLEGAALLDIPADEINFNQLGGTIKTAKVLARLPYSDWIRLIKYLKDSIPQHVAHLPEGKFTIGLSVYGLKVSVNEINRSMLDIKKVIKKSGRPVRVVPNKTAALNSAQVLHNKLTHKGAWELIFIADKKGAYLAQTLFVQDIDAYAARDQARPARDSRVGMLPPKLAQIILNLAIGRPDPTKNKRWDEAQGLGVYVILDPFCGSGVILQEALLMGYSVYGTDIEARMVDYTKKNLQWLVEKKPKITGRVVVEEADATNYKWPGASAVASEVYLGRPLNKLPDEAALKKIVSDTNTVIKKFLQNMAVQTRSGRKICLAVPAWRTPGGQLVHLPLLAKLTDMGYNRIKFKHVRNDDLVYFREGQTVARELLVLEKANHE